ncbi:MAG: SRPBCC family protein [Acidimicrobiales bacterium]|nr:SRPBCC family protein [Acidimicrobiales bacterium]
MPRILVSTVIDAPPEEVWASIEDVSTHTEWMADAVAIRFVSDRTSGVGTTFECDTKVGPFSLTDVMEITEWQPGKAMGVRHVGLVTGDGVFTLAPIRRRGRRTGRTRFQWTERMQFPWWMAGPAGGFVAKPVLRRIWKGNLRRLKHRVEQG